MELPQGKFIKIVETVMRRKQATAAPAQRLADFFGKPLVPNSPGLKEHLDRRLFKKSWHIVLLGLIYTLLVVVVVVMRYLKGMPMP